MFAGGDTNLFSYTWNDPINWTDSNGMCPVCVVPALPAIGTAIESAIIAGSAIVAGWGVSELIDAYIKPPSNAYDPTGPKAPGRPSSKEGYTCPKDGDNWVPNPNGPGWGWEGDNGDVWVPTGPGSGAHGGPHWDVQHPSGRHTNIYPGGKRR